MSCVATSASTTCICWARAGAAYSSSSTSLISEQIVDGIPGAEWALLEGTHCVHLERVEEYNATVEEFLERHE